MSSGFQDEKLLEPATRVIVANNRPRHLIDQDLRLKEAAKKRLIEVGVALLAT